MCIFTLESLAVPRLVSKAVGRVRSEVLTSRDVEINYVAERVLFSKSKISQINRLKMKSTDFQEEVSNLILEWVTYYESKLFPVIKMTSEDRTKAKKLLLSAQKVSPYWKSLGVTSAELDALLERKVLAKKFINFKAESSDVPITEIEARNYFEKNKARFGELPYENFSKEIKLHLGQVQKQKRLKDWFEILHAKYKVKRFTY